MRRCCSLASESGHLGMCSTSCVGPAHAPSTRIALSALVLLPLRRAEASHTGRIRPRSHARRHGAPARQCVEERGKASTPPQGPWSTGKKSHRYAKLLDSLTAAGLVQWKFIANGEEEVIQAIRGSLEGEPLYLNVQGPAQPGARVIASPYPVGWRVEHSQDKDERPTMR